MTDFEPTNELRYAEHITGKENVYYMGECSGSKDVIERVLQQRWRKAVQHSFIQRNFGFPDYDYEWRPAPTIKQES